MKKKVEYHTFDDIKTVGDLRKALKGVDKGTAICVYVYATGEEYPIAIFKLKPDLLLLYALENS